VKEADLYPALKAYLEGQGYVVKGEVGACDILARRGDEPAVVVEMKLSFSLALVMQGVARQALFDDVYLAVPVTEKGWKLRYKDIVALCRRLGLGLLAVKGDVVEAHLDPGPYSPRKNTLRAGRLLREFERRVGDPNLGGTTGIKRVTAYRQDALRCLLAMQAGAVKPAVIAKVAQVARAGDILRADHYGWFERISVGVYALTPQGRAAMVTEAAEIARLGGPDASV